MAVQLPTAADVRKAREQGAETARTPLLAALGAGDFAYTTVTKTLTRTVTEARTRATVQAEEVQHRVAELPQRFTPEALRSLVEELRAEAEERYAYFTRRGESTWGRLRKQPQVKQVITTIETYTERLDARVDDLVEDAHDVAEKALATVTRQTWTTGEKAARATQRVAVDTAATVAGVAKDASDAVEEAGTDAAVAIAEAGGEAAAATRSTTRRAAQRTAPKTDAKTDAKAAPKSAPKGEAKADAKAAPKTAGRKPATRTADGTAAAGK